MPETLTNILMSAGEMLGELDVWTLGLVLAVLAVLVAFGVTRRG